MARWFGVRPSGDCGAVRAKQGCAQPYRIYATIGFLIRWSGSANSVQIVSKIAGNRVNSGGLAWTKSGPQLREVSEEFSHDARLPD